MKKLFTIKLVFLYIFLAGFIFSCTELFSNGNGAGDLISLDQKVETLLSKMTLEEKIGQMNQYNGFWDFTGPAPKGGHAEKKYDDLKNGLVGSMLNVRGVKDVTAVQKVAPHVTNDGRRRRAAAHSFDILEKQEGVAIPRLVCTRSAQVSVLQWAPLQIATQ